MSTMRKAALLVGTAAIVVWGAGAFYSIHRGAVLKQRMSDVESLTAAYFENRSRITNISDLLLYLKERGVRLHNPIARDPQAPCYRLGGYSAAGQPNVVVEENENVADPRLVVRSYADGSVRAEKKNK